MDATIEGGFADLVFGAQGVFRATMEALARPGTPQTFAGAAAPPAPLAAGLGAIALTLCDHDSPVWLDPALAASPQIGAWLRFHTGAPLTGNADEAHFALVSDTALLPDLAAFAQGTDEYPDRSTTIMLTAGLVTRRVTLKGPGIKERLVAELPLPGGDFLAQWAENRERFPRGIDLLLAGAGWIVGLPRTTRISEG